MPTIGFNVESVVYKNLNFSVWDLGSFSVLRQLLCERFVSARAGGQTNIRPYWRCYYANTNAIIYVRCLRKREVSSISPLRLSTAQTETASACLARSSWRCSRFVERSRSKCQAPPVQEEELKSAVLLVFANKQDQKEAMTEVEVSQALGLHNIKDRCDGLLSCRCRLFVLN